MRRHRLYPVNVKLVRERKHQLVEVFDKVRPHHGIFMGVCLLNGCFTWESVGETYDSLEYGERLTLIRNEKLPKAAPLTVCKEDGRFIGELPSADSVLPNMLSEQGVNVYCYVEAKDFNGGMPEVAVSIYCDDY